MKIQQYWYLTLLYIIQYNSGVTHNEMIQEHVSRLSAELRRGLIVLVVMSQLDSKEYGYSLLRKLEERGFEVSQDTLYPLLRRLEAQGYLQSDWQIDEARPRRYYQLNELGSEVYQALHQDWLEQLKIIEEIVR